VGSKGTAGRREQGTVEYRSRLAGEDMPRKPLLDEAGQAATIPCSHPRIGTYHCTCRGWPCGSTFSRPRKCASGAMQAGNGRECVRAGSAGVASSPNGARRAAARCAAQRPGRHRRQRPRTVVESASTPRRVAEGRGDTAPPVLCAKGAGGPTSLKARCARHLRPVHPSRA